MSESFEYDKNFLTRWDSNTGHSGP